MRCSLSCASLTLMHLTMTDTRRAARCRHLHLHVISADLCSPAMKNKKHYNSFHPGRGFFLHLDDVMSWFDAEPSFWKQVHSLRDSRTTLLTCL